MTKFIQPIGPIRPISPEKLMELNPEEVITTIVKLACIFLFYLAVHKISKVVISKTPGFVYVRNIINIYEKQTKEELETALSIITTSYSRDGNIIMAVQENLPHIKPPLKECFSAFIGDAMAVSSSVKQALYNLKKKVDDEIFREWVDTLVQCQDNQEMKKPIKFTPLNSMAMVLQVAQHPL